VWTPYRPCSRSPDSPNTSKNVSVQPRPFCTPSPTVATFHTSSSQTQPHSPRPVWSKERRVFFFLGITVRRGCGNDHTPRTRGPTRNPSSVRSTSVRRSAPAARAATPAGPRTKIQCRGGGARAGEGRWEVSRRGGRGGRWRRRGADAGPRVVGGELAGLYRALVLVVLEPAGEPPAPNLRASGSPAVGDVYVHGPESPGCMVYVSSARHECIVCTCTQCPCNHICCWLTKKEKLPDKWSHLPLEFFLVWWGVAFVVVVAPAVSAQLPCPAVRVRCGLLSKCSLARLRSPRNGGE
jgi:hypothetical protein